jgi:hypothetical protein
LSSAPLRTRLACLAYMVVLVAAAVAVDRGIAHRLFADPERYVPAYRAFPEYAIGVKLEDLRDDPRHYDGFFLGNSRTLFGVDPTAVDRRLRERGVDFDSYNLALPTVDPRFWPFFARRYLQGRVPPHVFLGVLPRDIEARNQQTADVVRAFEASSGFRNKDMSAVSRAAEELLAQLFVLRGRASDAKLVSMEDVLRGRRLDLRPIRYGNDRGWALLTSAQRVGRAERAAQRRRLARRSGDLRFRLGEAQWRSILELDALVRRRGGCLTLFTTPILYDREQWGTVEMRRGFARALRRLTRDAPSIRFVDVGAQVERDLGLDAFGDGDHLDRGGAQRFSRALADALEPSVRDARCDGRPVRAIDVHASSGDRAAVPPSR